MSGTLVLRNRQRRLRIDLRLLRKIANTALHDLLEVQSFELGIYVVGAREIVRLNETFLRHKGLTDVISFDYRNSAAAPLYGEIFICVDEAIRQCQRFRVSWQKELVRYVIHGMLHLCGFDDSRARARRRMKCEEDRLLHQLSDKFNLARLKRTAKARRPEIA